DSPRFHWAVRVSGVTVAEGDTAVAAMDSVRVACLLPASPADGYDLQVVADPAGLVPETSEANNASTQTWGGLRFPTTGVIDSLSNNGSLQRAWAGNVSGLKIVNHALTQTVTSSYAIWNGGAFGPDQEAYVRLDAVTADAPEHDLLLKVQGLTWTAGTV